MSRITVLGMTILAGLSLTACSEHQVDAAQNVASAAIGVAAQHSEQAKELKDNIDQIKEVASAATAVHPELNQHIQDLKESAQKLKDTSTWLLLETKVGQYPSENHLFDKEPLKSALEKLLGKQQFETFKAYTQTQGPLEKDGILYFTGNKPHEGGNAAAYLLIDPKSQALEVGIFENGKFKTYTNSQTPLQKPKDIQIFIQNLE